MKKVLFIIFVGMQLLFATEQIPDLLVVNQDTLAIETGWGHKSILEQYYSQYDIKYPFEMISTANYRGHIATWTIKNDSLFLSSITREHMSLYLSSEKKDNKEDPFLENYDFIQDKYKNNVGENGFFAFWFSGAIRCMQDTVTTYALFENGNLMQLSSITMKDKMDIQSMYAGEIAYDESLEKKYMLSIVAGNYIQFHLRNSDLDSIEMNGKKGLIKSRNDMKLLYQLFDNKYLNFKNNWLSIQNCGAPQCHWLIEDDELLLSKYQLSSGVSLFEPEIVETQEFVLQEILNKSKIKADFISGVFVLGFEEKEKYFVGTSFSNGAEKFIVKIKKGNIIEKHKLYDGFILHRFNGEDDKLDKETVSLLKEFFYL